MNDSGAMLVGDIGGTNSRFAILDDNGKPGEPSKLRNDDFPSLTAALRSFLKDAGIDQLRAAAIAMANPVVGDQVKLTNNPWSISISETRESLGMERLEVINDWKAMALAVPHLTDDERVKIGGGEARERHTVGLIGPGTGLGVSGLVPCGKSDWSALQGEGGHVSLAVHTAREFEIQKQLTTRFRHVSAERFLSGPGLQNMHDALREIDGLPERSLEPAQITREGMDGSDATCRETLDVFLHLLGSCAGNLALTLGAEGGVYVGGGIMPRLLDHIPESRFRESFEEKGRMQEYLARIPTYVIVADYPALVGAAQVLRED